jgi:hypothetical protein
MRPNTARAVARVRKTKSNQRGGAGNMRPGQPLDALAANAMLAIFNGIAPGGPN